MAWRGSADLMVCMPSPSPSPSQLCRVRRLPSLADTHTLPSRAYRTMPSSLLLVFPCARWSSLARSRPLVGCLCERQCLCTVSSALYRRRRLRTLGRPWLTLFPRYPVSGLPVPRRGIAHQAGTSCRGTEQPSGWPKRDALGPQSDRLVRTIFRGTSRAFLAHQSVAGY